MEVPLPVVCHRPSSGRCVGSRTITKSTCRRPRHCPHGQGLGVGAEAPVVPDAYPAARLHGLVGLPTTRALGRRTIQI
eukprot:6207303-Pleurochrysis_carterae.AAC.1